MTQAESEDLAMVVEECGFEQLGWRNKICTRCGRFCMRLSGGRREPSQKGGFWANAEARVSKKCFVHMTSSALEAAVLLTEAEEETL